MYNIDEWIVHSELTVKFRLFENFDLSNEDIV